jgi:hypothetical protein
MTESSGVIVGAGLLLSLAVVIIAALRRIVSGGLTDVRALDRAGFDLPNWWRGQLPRSVTGPTIATSEGVTVGVSGSKLKAKRTRTVSKLSL